MNSFVINFVLACALMHVASGVNPTSAPDPQNLAHLFFRSRLAIKDPTVSVDCFSYYIVRSNAGGEYYSQDFKQCFLDAKAGRQAIEAEMVDKRTAIGESSQAICKHLSACDGQNSTWEVFDCHAGIGANNTKAVYSISGNASENANIMQEKYRIIDLRYEQCCNLAERTYVEATAANYHRLQECLSGRVIPSPPTTSTTTTTTTTTPQPTTTTTTTLAPATSIPENETTDASEGPAIV